MDDGETFTMQPPVRHVLVDAHTARKILDMQFQKFTGRMVLQVREGHVVGIEQEEEDAHATSG